MHGRRALSLLALMVGGCSMSGALPDWISEDAAGPEPTDYRFIVANGLSAILGARDTGFDRHTRHGGTDVDDDDIGPLQLQRRDLVRPQTLEVAQLTFDARPPPQAPAHVSRNGDRGDGERHIAQAGE